MACIVLEICSELHRLSFPVCSLLQVLEVFREFSLCSRCMVNTEIQNWRNVFLLGCVPLVDQLGSSKCPTYRSISIAQTEVYGLLINIKAYMIFSGISMWWSIWLELEKLKVEYNESILHNILKD